MKQQRFVLAILIYVFGTLAGCKVTQPAVTKASSVADSTLIRETERVSDAVGTIDIRRESKANALIVPDTARSSRLLCSPVSHLETEHAYSDAQIVNGVLMHTLQTKNEQVQVIIPGGRVEKTVEKRRSTKDVTSISKTDYTNILKPWQKSLMGLGVVETILIALWVGRRLHQKII